MSVESRATLTCTARSVSSIGSNTALAYERPGFSSPPNARRSGMTVGKRIGCARGRRVVVESIGEEIVTVSNVSPLTRPPNEKRPGSPLNFASRLSSRSPRDSTARLSAAVRRKTPAAG
ncbi:MAG: hypothetical protein DMD61_01765 [Gemmatimonadetes bacterium]|nr:MAG: hypothetical protein DMD61_01765 [Gemmatimonadota bacterium]